MPFQQPGLPEAFSGPHRSPFGAQVLQEAGSAGPFAAGRHQPEGPELLGDHPATGAVKASVGVLKISLAFSSVDCRTQFACADVRPPTGYVQFLNTLPLSCSQLETFLVFWKQVANLNPKDNTYSLKDFVFRDVRRDWPGYSEDEKIQVERILTR